MRSPALALAWQLYRPHRWGLSAVAAGLAVLAALGHLLPGTTAAMALLPLSSMFVFGALVYLQSVFAYANFNPTAESVGFPPRLFTLPVRTSVLVAWPMLHGMAAAALLWLAAAWLLFTPSGLKPSEFWWPALVCAAFMASFQAIAWSVTGSPLARLVVAVLFLPSCALTVIHSRLLTTLDELLIALPVVIFGSYVVAVVGVGRARCGATPLLTRLRHAFASARVRPPRGLAPFASPARAQLWCEWRRQGLLLPLLLGCFMLVLLIATPAGEFDAVLAARVLVAMVVTPLVLASFVGFGMGKTSFWARDLGLSAFTATRPVTSGALVLAKLRMAALSAAASWGLMLLLGALWVVLSGNQGRVAAWWAAFLQGRGALEGWAVVPLALFGVVALTWGQLVAGMCLGLTGRAWVVNGVTLACLVLAAVLTTLGVWTYSHPEFYDTLLVVLWAMAGVAVVAKLLAAWSLGRAVCRRGLLGAGAAWGLVAVWGGAVGALVGVNYLVVPAGRIPVHLTAVAAVLAVPLVRLLGAPLALAWNRHR